MKRDIYPFWWLILQMPAVAGLNPGLPRLLYAFYHFFYCYWYPTRTTEAKVMLFKYSTIYTFSLYALYSSVIWGWSVTLITWICHLNFRKPNKRVEVVQLSDVMDAMLERATVENQEYAGPTKVITEIRVKSMHPGGRGLRWDAVLLLISRWLWATHLMHLFLNLLTCKLWMLTVTTSQGCYDKRR